MSRDLNNVLPLGLFRQREQEREFLPAALEIIESPVSPVGPAVGGAIVACCAIAVLWASIGKIDIIADASGRLVPVGRVKTIQPFETGVVAAINVKDGDHVAAGQSLIDMDTIQAQADRDRYAQDLVRARLDLARLLGLQRSFDHARETPVLIGAPPEASREDRDTALDKLKSQVDAQQAKLAALDDQEREKIGEAAEAAAGIAKLNAMLPWTQQEADLRTKAMQLKFGNRVAWIEAESQLTEQQQEIGVLARHRDQAVAEQAEVKREREEAVAEYQRDALGDLSKAQEQVNELIDDLAKAQRQLELDHLRAPIAGTVESLAVHTVGGVVTPAQPLLVLVPDDAPLVVEVNVRNHDVGFVHVGQSAELKIDTFAFTRYGMIGGKVIELSRDATIVPRDSQNQTAQTNNSASDSDDNADDRTPSYVADISLDRNYMHTETGRVPLAAGMAATAEVYTGKRSIISFLLSPVGKLIEEAGHER